MGDMYKGSCLCGGIKFHVKGPLSDVVYCHCSQCRKQTGLYYAAVTANRTDLVMLSGEELIKWYQASPLAKRGFCSQCGSALFWKDEPEKTYLAIMAGTLDEPTGLKSESHIFCADKGDFYEITDGLPQYDQEPPSS